jgi:5-methylcytosine-specific restriction protein A
MPLKKLCAHPGCSALANPSVSRYCDAHRADEKQKHEWIRKESAEWRHLYRTARWRKYSSCFLLDHPICMASDCGALSDVCDHIEPHRGDEVLFWDPNNHQALCKRCHDRKTRAEQTMHRKSASLHEGDREGQNFNEKNIDHSLLYDAHLGKMGPLGIGPKKWGVADGRPAAEIG